MKFIPTSFLLLICLSGVFSWNNDELEIFDLVEEVNQNFYNLLDIPQDAGATDIRKAFRRLSLVLHPDKNSAPDADVKFRQLVAVYDVLRDVNKRQCYDNVLVNGLPDWRSAVYYYRRVRKMGLAEMTVILFVIVSVGQYLVSWAAYLEKRFNAEQYVSSKLRKTQKKQKKGKNDDSALVVDQVLAEIPLPSLKDTLPIQLPRLLWWTVTDLPSLIKSEIENRRLQYEEKKRLEEEERKAAEALEALEPIERGPRKRKTFTAPEITDDINVVPTQAQILAQAKKEMRSALKKPTQSGGLWTDEDIAELIRLVKKYPTGTPERWEKIADTMCRTVTEVTFMAHKVKEDGYRAPTTGKGDVESTEDLALMGKSKKMKTRGGKLGIVNADPTQIENSAEGVNSNVDSESWSQVQQKALETALVKYPKGSSGDRWEKISHCVPGKTKEECMLRFRYLVEAIKKKKEKEEVEEGTAEGTDETEYSETTEDAS